VRPAAHWPSCSTVCARQFPDWRTPRQAGLTDAQAAQIDEAWRTGGLFGVLLYYARLGHDPNWLKSVTELLFRASIIKIYSRQLIPAPDS
jgi:hypothetical protein